MTEVNRDLVEQIFQAAPFIGALGVKLISYGEGWCETTVDIVPTLQQQHGFVHAAQHYLSIALNAASRIPFKNAGDSAEENFLANSSASSITTFTGAVANRNS